MKSVKIQYVLIIIGVILIFGVGILIGINVANKKEVIRETNVTSDASIYEKNNKSEHNKEEKQENNVVESKDKEVTNNDLEKDAKKENITKTTTKVVVKESDTSNFDVKNEQSDLSAKDTTVINSLNNTLDAIEASEADTSFTTSAKATFINIVDFLFYDGTIKGITFNELTDTGKQKVLEIANKIDQTIENKAPGYKEKINDKVSSAYDSASNLIKKGAKSLNNFLESKLDETEYNSIIQAKDELFKYTKNAVSFLGDAGSSLFNSAKSKLSDWYQKYKNS